MSKSRSGYKKSPEQFPAEIQDSGVLCSVLLIFFSFSLLIQVPNSRNGSSSLAIRLRWKLNRKLFQDHGGVSVVVPVTGAPLHSVQNSCWKVHGRCSHTNSTWMAPTRWNPHWWDYNSYLLSFAKIFLSETSFSRRDSDAPSVRNNLPSCI